MNTSLAVSLPQGVPTPSSAAAPEAYAFGPFRVLAGLDLLFRGDDVVSLEPRAVCVLRHLVRQAGRVVGKEELLDEVWPDTFVTDSVLKKAVSLIRRALDDPPQRSRFIETYHRRGYRFIATVESAAVARPPALAPVERDERDLEFDQLAGRDTEMEALRAEYRRALQGQACALLVLGDAGIGKTQLSRHFQAWAERQGALCLYTRFFDYGGSRMAPAAPFLDLLRTALEVERPEELRAAIEKRLGVVLPAALFVASHGFAPAEPLALSSSEAAALSSQTALAIASCFVALSRRTPLVLQLDDLQWADPFALEVGTHLLRAGRGERLLLIALARPTGSEIGSETGADSPLATWRRTQSGVRGLCEIPLRGLSEEGFRQALAAILGHADCESGNEPDIAEEDLRRLHRLTGGNPYFLTEVLRGLAADGIVHRRLDGRWRCGGLRCLRLPETLATAARSLLQTLDPEVREILEAAAVLGDEVRFPLLALVTDRTAAEVERLLARALLSGAMSMAQLSPGEDCRFRHAILRQVLYDDLSPWRRRALHAQGARALEQLFAAEPDRVAEALAAHHRAAGELPRSFAWDLRASQAALGRWQWREALAGAERAREDAAALRRAGAASPAASDLIELRIVLGRCLSVLGRAREAEVELDAAALAARERKDESTLAHALFHLAQARIAQGRLAEARAASERALALFTAQADERAAGLVRSQLAGIRIAMGEYAAATEILEAEGDRQPVLGVSAAGTRGWALALQSRYAEAIPLLEIAAVERRAEDDARGLASVLRRLQWACLGRGDHARALAINAEAGSCFQTTGDLLGLARTGMSIGQALVAQGLAAKGLEKLRRAAEELRELGDLHCEAEALWLAGRALVDLGRLVEARPLLESALATVRQVPDRDDEFRISIDLARLLRIEGRLQEALDTARSAHAIALDLGSRDGAAAALIEVAFAHLSLAARGEALGAAEEAVDLLTRAGSGELWHGLWVLGLAQETWSLRLSITTLERCESLLVAARAPLGSPGDRRAVEEARRAPIADLHRLLLAADETTRARELRLRWPVALEQA